MINTDFIKAKGYDIAALAEGIGLPEEYFAEAAPVCETILKDCSSEFEFLKKDMRNIVR